MNFLINPLVPARVAIPHHSAADDRNCLPAYASTVVFCHIGYSSLGHPLRMKYGTFNVLADQRCERSEDVLLTTVLIDVTYR